MSGLWGRHFPPKVLHNGRNYAEFFAGTKPMKVIGIDGPDHGAAEAVLEDVSGLLCGTLFVLISDPLSAVVGIWGYNLILLIRPSIFYCMPPSERARACARGRLEAVEAVTHWTNLGQNRA